MPRPARGRSRLYGVIAASTAIVLSTVGTWLWLVQRPMVDEEELAAAGAYADDAFRDAHLQRCPREVLRGRALAGDATTAYAALLDPDGPQAECWAFVRANHDAVRAAMLASELSPEQWDAEMPASPLSDAIPDEPPAPDEWDSYQLGRPLRATPLPIESELLAACAGVAGELSSIVAHESVCGPYPLAIPRDGVMMVPLWLARVLVIAARARLRRGELREGFALLFDGLRAGNDIMRGRASALTTMFGAAVAGIVLGQLEILFAMDLPWDDATLLALQEEIVVLSITTPTPDGFVRDDAIAMMGEHLRRLGWTPPHPLPPLDTPMTTEDVARASAVSMHRAALRLSSIRCAQVPRAECLDRLVSASPANDDELHASEWLVPLVGPRAERERLFAAEHAQLVGALLRYAHRVAVLDAAIRAQWVVLEHRRLLLDGRRCLSAAELEAAIPAVPTEAGLGGHLEILESGLPYRPIEIGGPEWLRPQGEVRPRVRLPLARAYCPPLPIPDAPVQ